MRNINFRGIKPRTKPDMLEQNFASYASNCLLHDGAIRPLRNAELIGSALDVNGEQINLKVNKLHQAGDVLVGFSEPTFTAFDPVMRGGEHSFLFVKDSKLWRSSPSWVLDKQGAVQVGICNPTTVGEVINTGEKCEPDIDIEAWDCVDKVFDTQCQENPELLSFVYTYVNCSEEESAPSIPTQPQLISSLDKVHISVNDTPPDNAVKRRWYVNIPSGEQAMWYLVNEQPINEKSFTYCHSVFSFNDVLKTEDYNPPPSCIEGVASFGNGVTVVWQGKDIWFSEPRQPHAYPQRHRQTIDDNIVGIYSLFDPAVGGGEPFIAVVLTDGHPYILRGALPEEARLTKLARPAPCLNPMGVLCWETGVFFASNDGIYRVLDATLYNITTEWFTMEEFGRLRPRNMTIGYYNDRLLVFNDMTDGFMIKYPRDNNQYQLDCVYLTTWVSSCVNHRNGDLYVTFYDGRVYNWEKGHTRLIAKWRSKDFTNSGLWKPTSAKIISDTHHFALGGADEVFRLMRQTQQHVAPYFDVETFLVQYPEYVKYYDYLQAQTIKFTVYADAVAVYTRHVRANKPFRLKRDRRKINWGYEVTTQVDIREIHMQTSYEDLTQEGGHA